MIARDDVITFALLLCYFTQGGEGMAVNIFRCLAFVFGRERGTLGVGDDLGPVYEIVQDLDIKLGPAWKHCTQTLSTCGASCLPYKEVQLP